MWGYNTPSNMNVNPWTNTVGKICPGPGKIREYPDLLAAVARRVAGGLPPPPPPGGDTEMAMLIASSDGDATRKGHVFSWSGAVITQFPVDMDVISLADIANVLTINPSDPQRAFRRPASEIQALITTSWGGPRSSVPLNLGGYTIPADPAAAQAAAAAGAAAEAKRAADTAALNAANCLISVGPDLKTAVAQIPTTGGGAGGGLTAEQTKDVVKEGVREELDATRLTGQAQ
jgi:hypothetical protein